MISFDGFVAVVVGLLLDSAVVALLAKATLLLTFAWLMHFCLVRANPRWRVLLWRAAVSGLVLLAIWDIGLPRFEIDIPTTVATQPQAPVATTLTTETANPARQSELPVISSKVVEPQSVRTVETFDEKISHPQHAGDGNPSITWSVLVLLTWVLGVAVFFVRFLLGLLRVRQLSKSSKPAPRQVEERAQQIAVTLGCRGAVGVRCSSECAVPFLTGFLRPKIILPERMCARNFRRDLSAVLAHELAHVRSADLTWNAAIHVVSMLLWFHPLVWRIGIAHRAACDAVCDAVSAGLIGDVPAYCRVLAKVALETLSFKQTSALAMAQVCDVRRRVVALRRNGLSAPLSRRAIAAILTLGLLGLAIFAAVKLSPAEPTIQFAPDSTASAPAENREQQFRKMKIRALSRDGSPIADATVTVRASNDELYGPVRHQTDAEGIAIIDVPNHDQLDLQILVHAKRFVTVGAVWRSAAIHKDIPAELTVELEPGTSFGGIVQDQQGRTVANAKVKVDGRKHDDDGVLWYSIYNTVTTDEKGRWDCHRIPADLDGFEVDIEVRHPDFVATTVDYQSLSLQDLRDFEAVVVVHPGIAIEGVVTSPDGRPLPGAMVGQYRQWNDIARVTTDEDGQYRLPPSDPGDYVLAVVADGFAPNSRSISLAAGDSDFDLQLQAGKPIRIRVVDQEGNPVAGAMIGTILDQTVLFLDNTYHYLSGDRNLNTDAEGRWSRLWIPGDELQLSIRKDGHEQISKHVKPEDEEQVFTLRAIDWTVSGQVIDAQSEAPIPKFRVVEGYSHNRSKQDVLWRESTPVENKNGLYSASWNTSGDSRRAIRIEAEGYLPSETLIVNADKSRTTFDVELTRADSVVGVVLSPEGKPLAGADVVLCTSARGLFLRNGQVAMDQNPLLVSTKRDGKFSFSPPGEKFTLVVVHDQGFARVDGDSDLTEITLEPWAQVEGTIRLQSVPSDSQAISLRYDGMYEPNQPRIYYDYNTKTDEKGRFHLDKVVSGNAELTGNVVVDLERGMSKRIPTHTRKVALQSGETTEVDLSRTGRTVVGRFEMPDGLGNYDWRHAMLSAREVVAPKLKPPKLPLPDDIDIEKDREAVMEWYEKWKDTEEGKRYAEDAEMYNLAIAALPKPASFGTNVEPDGEFSFVDLPAGEYLLNVQAPAEPEDGRHHPGQAIASLSRSFTIPEMPDGSSKEPLDLGVLSLEKVPRTGGLR